VQKRIYGIETEYGIIFTPEGRKTLPVEKAIRFLARFYQDTGCHPEYATPECASPRHVILYDKAGERILEDLQIYAEEKIREERISGKLSIFKNNTDFVGNSYGCHENYLVDRDVDFYYLAEQLIPFLVTRQIYTGAGKASTSTRRSPAPRPTTARSSTRATSRTRTGRSTAAST
jgi:proteasome accessory factor A